MPNKESDSTEKTETRIAAGMKILKFIYQDETIKAIGPEQIALTLRNLASAIESEAPSREPKVSKQAMRVTREYIGNQIMNALWVSDKEKAGLRSLGYDPDKLLCIERFNDETIFLQAQFSGPICLSRKDGGGRSNSHTPVAKNGLSIYEKEATRLMADLKK